MNYHTSYSYGADFEVLKRFGWGILSAGTQVHEEKISSTNLGEHQRGSYAMLAQLQSLTDKRSAYNLGLRLDHYQAWGWQASPSLSIGYKVTPQIRLKAAGGHSFRIPSFSELYYQSPANVGNGDLTLERAWSAELGLDYTQDKFSAELNYFRRWAEELIGWARANANLAWEAQNFAEVDAEGIELDGLCRNFLRVCLSGLRQQSFRTKHKVRLRLFAASCFFWE